MVNNLEEEIIPLLQREDPEESEVEAFAKKYREKALQLLIEAGEGKWNLSDFQVEARRLVNYYVDAYGWILVWEAKWEMAKERFQEALDVYIEWFKRSPVNFIDVIETQLKLSSSKEELIELFKTVKKMELEYDFSTAEFAGGLEEVHGLLLKALSETE